jgi:hypothetical protein
MHYADDLIKVCFKTTKLSIDWSLNCPVNSLKTAVLCKKVGKYNLIRYI